MDKKCIACRVWHIHDDFIQTNRILKTCKQCRDNQKRWRGQHPDYMKQYRVLKCQYKTCKVRSYTRLINPCLYIVYENEVITFD